MDLRLKIGGIAIGLLAASAGAAQWGQWKTNEPSANVWLDHAELRPDIEPDAWLVNKLAGAEGDEVMLRSGRGAMLRWVSIEQMRYLKSVTKSIGSAAEIEVTLYVTRGDSPNAAAGVREGVNTVLVNFAMLDLVGTNVDEWAALVGHEVAHLKLHHADKQSKRNIPLTVLQTIGQVALAQDPLASAASGLLVEGIGMKFSRDAEREADYLGVVWAVQEHYDPYGAANLHQTMVDQSLGGSLPFISSHPSGPERIRTLKALADRLSGRQAPETPDERTPKQVER